MSRVSSLVLAIHCGLSFFLVLLGVFYLLRANALFAVLGIIGSLALFALGLRFSLPLLARSGKHRLVVLAEAVGSGFFANYAAFLLVVGLAKKAGIEPEWLTHSFLFGTLFGLIGWAYFQLKAQRRRKEELSHQAAVTESKRLLELDAPKDAEDKLKESLLSAELVFGSVHLHPAQAAIDLARYYLELEQRPKAAAMFLRALRIREQLLGDEDVRVSSALMEWVSADDSLEPGQAITQMRKALLILEKQLGAYAPPVALAYERVGELQQQQGQMGEAENALRRSFSILKKAESQTHRDQFRVGLKLARCYLAMAKPADAQEVLAGLDALTATQKPPMQLESLMVQMSTLNDLNEHQAAQDKAWAALQLLQRELGPQASEFKSIWEGGLDRLTEPFANSDAKTLYSAVLSGDTFNIRQQLQAHPEWISQRDATNWNIMQWACFFGHERLVDTLAGMGGSVDEAADEWPPLQIACRWGHRRLISSLASKVASQNQVAKGRWHAVHRCAQNGDNRLLELLTAKDLEMDPVNERGDTPLLIACRHGHYLFAVGMISKADVNKVNPNSGRSPLHEAAYVGHRAIVECLLLNGARFDVRDRAGLTPAELAAQAEKEIVVKQIQSYAKGHKA